MLQLLAVLLVCVAMSMVAAEANLLAVKVFKNDFFVQNRNLEVEFQFHNVGDECVSFFALPFRAV